MHPCFLCEQRCCCSARRWGQSSARLAECVSMFWYHGSFPDREDLSINCVKSWTLHYLKCWRLVCNSFTLVWKSGNLLYWKHYTKCWQKWTQISQRLTRTSKSSANFSVKLFILITTTFLLVCTTKWQGRRVWLSERVSERPWWQPWLVPRPKTAH